MTWGFAGDGGVAEVPFARHRGAVTGGAEGFGEGDAAIVELAAISFGAAIFHHVSHAGLVRI